MREQECQRNNIIVINDKDINENLIVNEIYSNVVERHKEFGNQLSERDKRDIKKTIKVLLYKNINKNPNIINLAMGKGKSTILLEFIKYMCKNDEYFSAVIVKKTLEEAKEFIIDLGCKEEGLNYKINIESLEDKYRYDEDSFIAKLVRGFNRSDCIKYHDSIFGDSNYEEHEFTYELCRGCELIDCKVKLSKQKHKEHRILVITHARLFLSNDNNEIIANLSEWVDKAGQKHSRELLLIDEKIDTFHMETFKLEDWRKIKNSVSSSNLDNHLKEQVEEIDNYFRCLKFPEKAGEVLSVSPYEIQMETKTKEFLLKEGFKPKGISVINNFLKQGGCCGRHWNKTKEELVSYCKYIDVADYSKENFRECFIFDATSKRDFDYNKSNISFVNDLQENTSNITIYYNSSISLSKSKIIDNGNYKRNVGFISRDVSEVIEKTGKKTLIVVYKEMYDSIGKHYNFKVDMQNELKKHDFQGEYKVIHFGEYTTGVNFLKNFEDIIIIGQLDKGDYYYNCKSLYLGLDKENIKINEFLTSNIQQIGRTALRSGKQVNVYLMGIDEKLVEGLKGYFNTDEYEWQLKNFNEFNMANDIQKDMLWYKIVDYTHRNLQNVGETIKKDEIKKHILSYGNISVETYRSALKNSKTKRILKVHGIIQNPKNNREFLKVG